MSPDGTLVGKISKESSGEGEPDKDNFSVSFPTDLDVRSKALLIGAVFLINFLFFEASSPDVIIIPIIM